MTMIITIMEKDRVHMIADGAGMMPDGTLGGRLVKLLPMPHLNLVVGCRGNGIATTMVGLALCGSGATFDEVKANAPRALQDLHAAPGFPRDVEVFVAGWSEANGPCAWMIVSHAREPGVLPFEVTDLGRIAIYPAPEIDSPELLRAVYGRKPMDHLTEIVMAVRQTSTPITWGESITGIPSTVNGYAVGAFVQIATVMQTHISTACLLRFPGDEIGKPIDPGRREMAA
jgi:hypothetical protein